MDSQKIQRKKQGKTESERQRLRQRKVGTPRKLGERYEESWRPRDRGNRGCRRETWGRELGGVTLYSHPPSQDSAGSGLPCGHGRRESGGQLEEDKTP